MRTVPLSEVSQYSHKEVIPSIRGRITGLYERNSGTNATGEWSIQNLTIKGDDGTEIKVKVCDHDDIPKNWKGKMVVISSNEGTKGLTGVYAFDDDYRNVITRIIKVTSTGKIEPVDGQESAPTAPPRQTTPTPARQETPPAAAPQTNSNGHHQGNGTGQPDAKTIAATRKAINQTANLYLACLDAGEYVRDQYNAKHAEKHGPMSPDQFQATVSSIFIQASREGCVMPKGNYSDLNASTAANN